MSLNVTVHYDSHGVMTIKKSQTFGPSVLLCHPKLFRSWRAKQQYPTTCSNKIIK